MAQSLVALHGTDPASVYLSAAARIDKPTVRAIEQALYEERSLMRMLGMRRTVFVVPTDLGFGMARMYEMLSEARGGGMRVFRDYDEARRWVELGV